MLVFIDYEHESAHSRERGERILAARTWITYRLEDISGQPCHLVRYDRVDQTLIDRLGATALFISGNSTDPADYDQAALEPVRSVIRTTRLPVFGFCGGLQLIATALDAPVVPLDAAVVHDDDPMVVRTDDGRVFEYGYHATDIAADAANHPLVRGIGNRPVFRHAHGLHVPQPPEGFVTLASTRATPVQMVAHDERRIVGTQFHPEYWTDEHRAGKTLIANFCAWALSDS